MSSIIMKQGNTSSVSLSYKLYGSATTGSFCGLIGETASWWEEDSNVAAWGCACNSAASSASHWMWSIPTLKIFSSKCMGIMISKLDRIWRWKGTKTSAKGTKSCADSNDNSALREINKDNIYIPPIRLPSPTLICLLVNNDANDVWKLLWPQIRSEYRFSV